MHLDHIVHFIEETPEQAAAHWSEKGFYAAVGGRHEQWGTHNALLYLKNCYVEWLAVEKMEIARNANHPLTALLLHDRQGFGTVCLRTDRIEALNERLIKEGFETSGILSAQRKTGSGDVIRWKMLFLKEGISDRLPAPFFIEWEETDEMRYESLRKRQAIQPSNEKLELDSLIFGVHDPEESRSKWVRILGGSLQLPNCRIEFEKIAGRKERLQKVVFKQGETEETYEAGVYELSAQGNREN